jgi:Mg2+/Co2+ transporter CorB
VWILTKSTAGVCRFLGLSSQKEGITEDEIKAIVREGTEGGCVQEVEQDIVERVFNLGDRNISSASCLSAVNLYAKPSRSLCRAINASSKLNIFIIVV